MRIALCDDEPNETEQLSRLIHEYAVQRDCDITCERFVSGSALLRQERFDLYFLDFRMDEMDGIAVAKALKEKFNKLDETGADDWQLKRYFDMAFAFDTHTDLGKEAMFPVMEKRKLAHRDAGKIMRDY